MIKSITVVNDKGESLDMELSRPDKCGVIVKEVKNIGPGDATVNIEEMASVDGGIFSSSRASSRTISLKLQMMFYPQIEDSRHIIYKYFPLKKKIRLIFNTDSKSSWIEGYVSKHNPDIFSKEETADIDVKCPFPFFRSIGGQAFAFAGSMGLFEFPFSNESLTDNLIEFGDVHMDEKAYLTYIGEIETGFVMNIHCLNAVTGLRVFSIDSNKRIVIDDDKIKKIMNTEDYSFISGDDIIISTVAGNIYAKLVRYGTEYNIIGALGKNVDWFELNRGDNVYAFSADDEMERYVVITFLYDNVYGGI